MLTQFFVLILLTILLVFLKRYVFKPYFRRRDLKRILIKELPVDLEDNLKKTIYKHAVAIVYAVEESLEKEIYYIYYRDLSLCTPSKVLEKVEGLVIDHFKKRLLKCRIERHDLTLSLFIRPE